MRLSEAHCCLTGNVLKHLVHLYGDNSSLKEMLSRGGGPPFYKRSYLMNGKGNSAKSMLVILETATHVQLKGLTLHSMNPVLTDWHLIERVRRWCPLCFHETKEAGGVYEQLLWSFRAVSVCPIHQVLLEDECPFCGKQNYYVEHKARVGHCAKCGAWLGTETREVMTNDPWSLHVARNLNELVECHDLHDNMQIANAISFIKELIQQQFEGEVTRFATFHQFPLTNVYSWIAGKHQPSLQSLLRVSFVIDIPLVDMLSYNQDPFPWIPNKQLIDWKQRKYMLPRYESTQRLKMDEGDLQALEMRIQKKENILNEGIQQAAESLGLHVLTFKKHFPDLCKKMVRTRKKEQYRASIARRRANMEATKRAVTDLKQSGIDPTIRLVESYMGKRRVSPLLYPEAYQILSAIQNEG
jgi:ribosomal protein S27AE